MKIINDQINYWLVRTEGGAYYEQFVAGNYIGVGWNEISNLDAIIKSPTDEEEKEKILKQIRVLVDKEQEKTERPKGERERESQKSRIYNQINRFANEMSVGDYVLIPSPRSNLIEFGIITSTAYISNKNMVDIEEGECDFLKRRDVKWLYREKRTRLDPNLYGLIYSQHAISSANDYAHYINRTIHKFYIKGHQAHLVLEVGKESEIYGSEFIQMMSSVFDLVDVFNEVTESDFDKNRIQIAVNVQSPGPVELYGSIGLIVVLGAAIAGIIGGKVSLGPIKFDSPGLLEKIRQFMELRQSHDLEKEKIALQRMQLMQIKTPPELQASTQEESTEQGNN